MTEAQITNGIIKYGETRKIADFENKRADVEISFTIADAKDAEQVIENIQQMVRRKCVEMLGLAPILPAANLKPEHLVSDLMQAPPLPTTGPAPARKPRAPKMPEVSAPVTADPAAMDEPTVYKEGDVVQTSDGDKAVAMLPVGPATITDADLMDATTKCQQAVKNSPAIRKLLNQLGVVTPPGRLIDLPQVKRQEYLDGLKTIKPLA